MSPLIIAQIIAQYGVPLAAQLYAMYHAGVESVPPDKFVYLMTLANYSPDDALAAAGIKIVDGKVVPLLTPPKANP